MKPLSRETLLENGECCGSGCTNCPYLPRHQKEAYMIECITCYGEGKIEVGPICGMPASHCCGGCYEYQECEDCRGTGEVEL